MAVTHKDLAYANATERALIALALREMAEDIKVQVTVQTRTEEYARNRCVDKLLARANEYQPVTETVVTGD